MVVYIAINTYLKKSNKTKYKSFTNVSSFSKILNIDQCIVLYQLLDTYEFIFFTDIR